MQLITYRADSILNFGIFVPSVQYWSFVDASPLNKSIEMTLRMQVISLNKSIGVRLPNYSIDVRNFDLKSPLIAMLPHTDRGFTQFATDRCIFERNAFSRITRILW